MQDGSKKGDRVSKSDVNLNFKDADMEVRNKLDKDACFTVDSTMFKVADGVDVGLKFVTPKASDNSSALFKSVTPSASYKTADLYAKGSLEIGFDSASALAPCTGVPKINVEVLGKVMDDITAGLQIKDMEYKAPKEGAESQLMSKLDLAVNHTCCDMHIQGHMLAALKGSDLSATALTASVFQKVGATSMAAEFKLEGDCSAAAIKMSTAYALTPTSDLKTKVTVGTASKPILDFAWVQKFEGKSLTLSHNYSPEATSPAFGVGCVIDI